MRLQKTRLPKKPNEQVTAFILSDGRFHADLRRHEVDECWAYWSLYAEVDGEQVFHDDLNLISVMLDGRRLGWDTPPDMKHAIPKIVRHTGIRLQERADAILERNRLKAQLDGFHVAMREGLESMPRAELVRLHHHLELVYADVTRPPIPMEPDPMASAYCGLFFFLEVSDENDPIGPDVVTG